MNAVKQKLTLPLKDDAWPRVKYVSKPEWRALPVFVKPEPRLPSTFDLSTSIACNSLLHPGLIVCHPINEGIWVEVFSCNINSFKVSWAVKWRFAIYLWNTFANYFILISFSMNVNIVLIQILLIHLTQINWSIGFIWQNEIYII